jgi:nitrite reductase/ring-hydroxylating ferredoxin subunit
MPRLFPITLDGANGHVEDPGDFSIRESAEVPHFDHPSQPVVDGSEVCECVVHAQHFVFTSGHVCNDARVQADMLRAAAVGAFSDTGQGQNCIRYAQTQVVPVEPRRRFAHDRC